MSEYKKKIIELRKKISARDIEIHEIKIAIGNEISQLQKNIIDGTPLYESYEKAGELKKIIPEKEKAINEIKKLDKKMEDLNKKTLVTKASLSEREKTYTLIYEKIGNTAYARFKMNREKLLSYEYIFTELLKLDAKFRQFNKVDISEKTDEKRIIKQFIDVAKSMYRNQKYKLIQLRYPGLYRQAGKAILTTDFVEDAAAGELDAVMKPLMENEKIILQLNKNLDEISNEISVLQDDLRSLEVSGKPQKKIHEINEEIKRMEERLNEYYLNISNLFFKQNLFDGIENVKIGEYRADLSTLENENEKCEEEIKQYETLIEIDKLKSKMLKTNNRIDHTKNQIKKEEQELKELEKEFSQLEKQKKILEKMIEPQ